MTFLLTQPVNPALACPPGHLLLYGKCGTPYRMINTRTIVFLSLILFSVSASASGIRVTNYL